ncbi:MAG TPA: undecaprenyldiphospho-muramoylpentapeptide beta-N-acetylglucosaminyltransferase [Alphaproteobacteria bacterium]|nr:undecaprenyldiphospho-muramoylpentapeptide beta-N-acetylglucosaminyltransferase [Alphaproteobacteria bacterium]
MAKKMKNNGTILIASGASGGHLIPALAVADELKKLGWKCTVVLGGGKFSQLVEQRGYPLIQLPASGFNVANPLRKALALLRFCYGFLKAYQIVRTTKPAAVFGTGGYASVAVMLAAKVCHVPCVGHEQNVLPGRANRLLARIVNVMALSFAESKKLFPRGTRTAVTGMPLRSEVITARKLARKNDKKFHILVSGGSQGSRMVSDMIPAMLGLLPAADRRDIAVVHQSRPDDMQRTRELYKDLGVKAEVKSFFSDLPERTRWAHIVIGRSGASTVAETAMLGRAAIYVPLVLADGHQVYNAQVAEKAGAAIILEQPLFTPAGLLVHIKALRRSAAKLAAMEAAALKVLPGAQHGAANTARLVNDIAKGKTN